MGLTQPDQHRGTRVEFPSHPTFDEVVVANRLPVTRDLDEDGSGLWRTSPGGLVTAMGAITGGRLGAWVGWTGDADEVPEPFVLGGSTHLVPLSLGHDEVSDFHEGFSTATLWPLYHDVIAQPVFRHRWWDAYLRVNERFASSAAACAAPGATVWVHDYQLQLVPDLIRRARPDVRIGWFNHIPFPAAELFSQLPWREEVLRGLLGADVLGFQRRSDADNFLRTCAQVLGLSTEPGSIICPDSTTADPAAAPRRVSVTAMPVSVDAQQIHELARSRRVTERSREIRRSLGDPKTLLLGVDRLDYTKGIRHRLRAVSELLAEGELVAGEHAVVQVATPSRDRVAAYRGLRDEIEGMIGNINGDHADLGVTAVHYLHQRHSREEIVALHLAADVLVVTPLRDGMNLVAKEFVAARADGGGALVLSEFAGAADELDAAYLCNPHDLSDLKRTILRAMRDEADDARRRMHVMRQRVLAHDVHAWAAGFLAAVETMSPQVTRG